FLMNVSNTGSFSPGPIAYGAAGIAGAACVLIAGLTTANPTLYRAGLAIQSINPKWKTWKVTLCVGLFTTVAATFPALVMRLLDFVALYGLILMPVGAVVFIDVYVLERLGLKRNYAELTSTSFNWSVGITWLVTLVLCLSLNLAVGVEIFFLGLPGWFIAVIIYLICSKIFQNGNTIGSFQVNKDQLVTTISKN